MESLAQYEQKKKITNKAVLIKQFEDEVLGVLKKLQWQERLELFRYLGENTVKKSLRYIKLPQAESIWKHFQDNQDYLKIPRDKLPVPGSEGDFANLLNESYVGAGKYESAEIPLEVVQNIDEQWDKFRVHQGFAIHLNQLSGSYKEAKMSGYGACKVWCCLIKDLQKRFFPRLTYEEQVIAIGDAAFEGEFDYLPQLDLKQRALLLIQFPNINKIFRTNNNCIELLRLKGEFTEVFRKELSKYFQRKRAKDYILSEKTSKQELRTMLEKFPPHLIEEIAVPYLSRSELIKLIALFFKEWDLHLGDDLRGLLSLFNPAELHVLLENVYSHFDKEDWKDFCCYILGKECTLLEKKMVDPVKKFCEKKASSK